MSKVLEPGNYILEEGMTIERTGCFITVRPKKNCYPPEPCCADCKFFGEGRATRCGWTTNICLKQPKNRIDKDGVHLYYHVGNRKSICDKFEKNEV